MSKRNIFANGKTRPRFRFKNSPRTRFFFIVAFISVAVITRIIRYNLSAFKTFSERNYRWNYSVKSEVLPDHVSLEQNTDEAKNVLETSRNAEEEKSIESETFKSDDVLSTTLEKNQSESDSNEGNEKESQNYEVMSETSQKTDAYNDHHDENDGKENEETRINHVSQDETNTEQNIKVPTETDTVQSNGHEKSESNEEKQLETQNNDQYNESRHPNLINEEKGNDSTDTFNEQSLPKSEEREPSLDKQSEPTIDGKGETNPDIKSEENHDEAVEPVREGNLETITEDTGLNSDDLGSYLNFSEKTSLNFMHFHKTGGVSFKTALFTFFSNKVKRSGEAVRVRDACYRRSSQAKEGAPTFDIWRCDWMPLWELGEIERNKYDVIFGHQYRVGGAERVLNWRDVKTFSVLRHPFDRKVSFFFHFFIRERGRNEADVDFEEVRDFLLYDKLRDSSLELGKDLGPNYMAGRILSDGKQGYVGDNRHKFYKVPEYMEKNLAENALKIIRSYIFVGLQTESAASMCMLRKTIENFNTAQGISNEGTEKVAARARVLNTGSYLLNSTTIWGRLKDEERMIFNKKENVDISIYEEGERLFKKQVKMFQCESFLKGNQL